MSSGEGRRLFAVVRAVVAVLACFLAVVLGAQSVAAQVTDPYGGGSVTPPGGGGGGGGGGTPGSNGSGGPSVSPATTSCPDAAPQITTEPPSPVEPGQAMTATTTGHIPGSTVTVFSDGVPVASGPADANGTFTTPFNAPNSAPRQFFVCASSPLCAPVCGDPITIQGTKVLGETLSRVGNGVAAVGAGFARTGGNPFLLAAIGIACLAVGRRLQRVAKYRRRRRALRRGRAVNATS
jgi:hypothetical protein